MFFLIYENRVDLLKPNCQKYVLRLETEMYSILRVGLEVTVVCEFYSDCKYEILLGGNCYSKWHILKLFE